MFRTGSAGQGNGGSATLTGLAGRLSISNGASSQSVTFSSAKASTNYEVHFSIMNTLDSQPIFLMGYISALSTTGFTVTFNAPTDSGNYLFCWGVIDDV